MNDQMKSKLSKLKFNKGAEFKLDYPMIEAPDLPTRLHNPGDARPGRVTPPKQSGMYDLLIEVMDVVQKVQKNIYPLEFMERYFPAHWGEFRPHDLPEALIEAVYGDRKYQNVANLSVRAEAVRMDDPRVLALVFKKIVASYGQFKLKDHRNYKHFDFHGVTSDFNVGLEIEMEKNIKECFANKYYYGVPRPEELHKEVFPELNQNAFTAYVEGCPNHPSFPAGHGTYAGTILAYYLNNLQLTPDVILILRTTSFRWSMWRTWAGVHYGPDNMAGLMIVGGGY